MNASKQSPVLHSNNLSETEEEKEITLGDSITL